MNPPDSVPLEHQNVPTTHQGLHEFLYSSDDEHGAIAPPLLAETINNDLLLPISEWSAQATHAKIAGVYAVFDLDRQPQYVGYSRNLMLSLNGHVMQLGSDICAFVRVQPFKFPKRAEMESLRDAWIAEFDRVPPGNADASDLWVSTVSEAAAAMSAVDRAAYEEKKLKLRKAMADSSLVKEQEVQPGRPDLSGEAIAIEQDDWSAVIGKQTEETR
jgi:hypothetical protein